ncbi:MAG: molybdopterin-synthase adenylyltransferase MoeB [Alphaproteobacteria bacterium]|nr:molybdopterin-synthase adenylyltransferase MoeB [Alphaproteobacteria bacterium]
MRQRDKGFDLRRKARYVIGMGNDIRYQRQVILDEIGENGQRKLGEAAILCIGAGGLGCPALLYLAAAGVGRIGIVDFDNVDESNLQRQTLYSVDQIGQNKAAAAKARLAALNPEIEITAYETQLSAKNAREMFESYDLIIDGTDNFTTKYLINDMAVETNMPFIYGAIQGFEGQVSVFGAPGAPCYRCLYPQPPKEHIPTCAENGVIGAVAGIIGTAQAMEAIKLIVGGESFTPLIGTLFCIDLRDMRTRTLALPRDAHCPACSDHAKALEHPPAIEQILPTANYEGALLIDVREQEEWDAGYIEGAQHRPLSILMHTTAADLPKDRTIVLYCAKGQRSQYAAEILQALGYANVKNMVGGYDAWVRQFA